MNPADRRASLRAHNTIRDLARRENLSDVARREGVQEMGDSFWKTNSSAVLYWREFVKAGGLQLTPKLWRLELGARQAFADAVEDALVHGRSSPRQARNFLDAQSHMLSISPEQCISAIDAAINKDSDVDERVDEHVDGMFHHYINLAHGSGYIASAEGTKGFAGWRYMMSPVDDYAGMSALYAEQNLYGLGCGVYPDRQRCPWPIYRDLSFVEIVFDNEITPRDRKEKETSIQALARLPEMYRLRILGEEKAHYFDKGWLRSWMIGSRDAAVRKRFFRTGKLQKEEVPIRSDDALSLDEFYLLSDIARSLEPFVWNEEEWRDEEPEYDSSRVIARLIDKGLVEHLTPEERLATLVQRLAKRTKMPAVRALCAELGLARGGKKLDLIQRIVQKDPIRAEALTDTPVLVKATDAGRVYIAAQEEQDKLRVLRRDWEERGRAYHALVSGVKGLPDAEIVVEGVPGVSCSRLASIVGRYAPDSVPELPPEDCPQAGNRPCACWAAKNEFLESAVAQAPEIRPESLVEDKPESAEVLRKGRVGLVLSALTALMLPMCSS